ncbi:MAG: hypothetical protein LBQ46_00540 [Treponema sp.]|nr:hypothetical protein [Treponema sp.]
MYSSKWSRLDNAAKIFPPNTTKDDTKVFRLSCELYEAVDPGILASALGAALDRFPLYRFIIRRGFFWYYFTPSDLQPLVREEYKVPCAPLYDVNRKNLLFEVTYWKMRINLEAYHALSDGAGALQFFKTIVYHYLLERHGMDETVRLDSSDASDEQKGGDPFDRFYSKGRVPTMPRAPRAYRVRGARFPESRVGIIEGRLSTGALIGKARSCQATISEFLTALLISAIHEGMTSRDEERPVSITVPVDLRKYFGGGSAAARNFFGLINVSHNFRLQGGSFREVLEEVKRSYKSQLRPEKLYERLNLLLAFEHALYIKMVPLAIKVPALKTAARTADRGNSASFSNMGKISMPPAMVPHIRLFGVFYGAKGPHVCLCSFEDNLAISFLSPFVSRDIQRAFFRSLSALGLDIEIVSNLGEG